MLKSTRTLLLLGDLSLARVTAMNLNNKKVLNNSEEKAVNSYYVKALGYYLESGDSSNAAYYVKLSEVYKKLGKKLRKVVL